MQPTMSFGFCAVPALLLCLMLPALAGGQEVGGNLLPDGFYITPTAAPGSIFQGLPTGLRSDGSADANGAVTTALSPDGTALRGVVKTTIGIKPKQDIIQELQSCDDDHDCPTGGG